MANLFSIINKMHERGRGGEKNIRQKTKKM